MVLVVGHVEADELMVLAVLMLDEGEDEAAELLFGTLNLEGLLATVFQPGVRQALRVGDGHGNHVILIQL